MTEFKPSFEKKEIKPSIDSLADQVSRILDISKGKNRFLKACDEVFNRYPIFISSDFDERLELKRKISEILNKRKSPVKQEESPVAPKGPALTAHSLWQEMENRRVEKLRNDAPLFADQIEQEERRHFNSNI